MCKDPKCAKRQPSHQCLFALFGFAHKKTASKMLMKLTPVRTIGPFLAIAHAEAASEIKKVNIFVI